MGNFTYALYGVQFSSNRPFTACLVPGQGAAAVDLSFLDRPLVSEEEWGQFEKTSPLENDAEIQIWRGPHDWLLRFPGTADFRFAHDGFRAHVLQADRQVLAEIQFLDCVLPLWLELRGTPFLHASAVEWHGQAIAFSTFAGGGKSSLATRLTRRGGGFVTDDVLVLGTAGPRCLAFPGYPQIRLWGDAASRLLPPGSHEPIHASWPKRRGIVERWAELVRDPLPLAAVYLVAGEDRCEGIEITPLGGREAFFQLLENSPALAALDYAAQGRRAALVADVMRMTPIRRLRYPKSYELLDEVLDAVLADVGALA